MIRTPGTARWAATRAAAATIAAAVLSACGSSPPVERAVLVTVDTLRADHVGCYGDTRAATPTLDALATSGVRFAWAISPTPLTLPSHTSLMTALEPPHHGVRENSVFRLAEDVPTLAQSLHDAGFATAAFVGAAVLRKRYGLDRGFDLYDDDIGTQRASRVGFSFAERKADVVVDAALAWLAHAPDRFFLWVHLYDPHADYDPPPEYLKRADGDPYSGEIAFADSQIGRLLQAIEARYGRDGLWVGVTSDHGESLGEHDEATHALTVYDATQHVPLIVRAPGWPAGRVVEAQVRLIDVAPTLLASAGAAALPDADGRDLRDVVSGRETGVRPAYVETLATQIQMGWSPILGLRTPEHKYLRVPRRELYDLAADPRELENLAPGAASEVERLDAQLATHLERALPVRPTTAGVDEEQRAQLESLGYVVPEPDALAGRSDLGVVGGPDPKDHMGDLATMNRASLLVAQGRPEEALALLSKIDLPGPRIHWIRTEAALAAGEGELAVASARRVVALEGRRPANLIVLGLALTAAGRFDEARAELQSAAADAPEAADLWFALGKLAEAEGRTDDALGLYERAVAAERAPGAARVQLATLWLTRGDLGRADALLDPVPAAVVDEPSSARALAAAESRGGHPERALARLQRAYRAQPDVVALARDYASALDAAGRAPQAAEIWRRIYLAAPADAVAQNDLAWGLASAGTNLDTALALARAAVTALAEAPAALDTLATVHWARGEWSDVLDTADRALAKSDPGQRAHLELLRAVALHRLGRDAEARRAVEAARDDPKGLSAPWRRRADDLADQLSGRADAAGG